MRIKAGQHAIKRVLDQGFVGDRIDVIEAHTLEHIAKQSEQPVCIRPVTDLVGNGLSAEGDPTILSNPGKYWASCYTSQKDSAERQGGAETLSEFEGK